MIRRGEQENARSRADGSRDALLLAVGRSLSERGLKARGILEMAYAEEERRLNRYMTVLDTVITLAPLLGILGTVLGIIDSFDLLGAGGARDPMAVTGGIARALITTATGLSIAILTLIPFNFFRSRADSSLTEIEEVATFLETYTASHGLRETGE
jgi:biopolymer transport protein ExbB